MKTEWKWLDWARRLQTIAQNGLLYATTSYDQERYKTVKEIAAEILVSGSKIDQKQILQIFSAQTGYATPKVDTRGVVFKDDLILLVKEKEDGGWTLPGGWADPSETPSQAVAREVYEESGFVVKPTKLLAVYDRTLHGHTPPHPFRIYKHFFLCEILGGKSQISPETLDVGFFLEDKIPPLSLGRTTPSQISRLFEHRRNPNWPTDFD